MFVRKGVLKNPVNLTGNHLCWSLFLINLQAWHPFWRTSVNDCICTELAPLVVTYPFYFIFSTCRGISYHFPEILTEAALKRIIYKCLYWNLRKKWWNEESARPSTLLILESTTGIFIDQVHKFQNSDFREYPWKPATVLQKNTCFKNML